MWSLVLTLYPGDVRPLIEESPDQLAEGGAKHWVSDEGLAAGDTKHALVRGAECHKVPNIHILLYKCLRIFNEILTMTCNTRDY